MRFGQLTTGYLGKFWTDLADVGIDAKLPVVKVIEKNRIMLTDLAYFKDDKMVGKLSPIEIGAYLAMRERNPGGYTLSVSTDDGGLYFVESLKRNARIIVDVKNGKPTALIKVDIESSIKEETNANDLGKKKLEEVEKKAGEKGDKLFNDLVKKTQEKESDVLGIGAKIRAFHSDYWNKEVKTDERWLEIYKEMDIEVKVAFNIRRTGMDWK